VLVGDPLQRPAASGQATGGHRKARDEADALSLSRSTASRICQELRERFEQFQRRDLYDIGLAALFLDAVFLSVRPDGPKEGVLVAWGFTQEGEPPAPHAHEIPRT
jgi:hypothetical protein